MELNHNYNIALIYRAFQQKFIKFEKSTKKKTL